MITNDLKLIFRIGNSWKAKLARPVSEKFSTNDRAFLVEKP